MSRLEEWGINLLHNRRNRVVPKQFLFRLTFLNILVVTAFVGLSSWAIYNAACVLAEGLIPKESQRQAQFEATLLNYLWIFSVSTIISGSFIHFYFTKRLIQPLKELISSTKKMKQGEYPQAIKVDREDEIGELIHHFNDLVLQLENNEEQRQKVVSDLSHEFRTPLSNLSGYLHALQTGVIQADGKLYQSLKEETKRLIQLVEQMEQLKEWDYRAKLVYSPKDFTSIHELVDQSVEMFRWILSASTIPIQMKIEPSSVKVNSSAIIQVISNLLDNAIRYYEGNQPIVIKGKRQADSYQISITGEGKCIGRNEHERIFERFYRTGESESENTGGTGLGLAISKEIIEHHNGDIGVTTAGNLHTFWFTLPLVSY